MLELNTAQTALLAYVAYQLISAAVQSLPAPAEYGGIWYKAFYNFASLLVGDFKSYISKYNSTITTTASTATLQPSGAVTATQSTNTETVKPS